MRDRMMTFASMFEWELLGARDSVNHGISITSRPNEKLVIWERKSVLDQEADVFLRNHGVKGLRLAPERRHDTTRGSSVLDDTARIDIVSAYQKGESQTSLAERFGVSRRLIFEVLNEAGVTSDRCSGSAICAVASQERRGIDASRPITQRR